MQRSSFEDYVDFVTVTNMDKDIERWEFMQLQLRRENILAHRINGVDGSRRLPLYGDIPIEVKHKSPDNVLWNHGMAGCMASLVMTLALAKWSGCRSILYMEDDAILPHNFRVKLARVMDTVPYDWDVINFGPWHLRDPKPVNQDWVRCTLTVNCHCVLIRGTALDFIIAALNRRWSDPERTLSALPINYYAPKQWDVPQRGGWSRVAHREMGEPEGRVTDDCHLVKLGREIYHESPYPRVKVRKECMEGDLYVIDEVLRKDAYRLKSKPPFKYDQPIRVIDAGHHVGSFTHLVRSLWRESTVCALDADPAQWPVFRFNHHDDSLVRQERGALLYTSSKKTDIKSAVFEGSTNTGLSSTVPGDKIPCFTVEDIMAMMFWSKVDLLKLDIEGDERLVMNSLNPKLVRCIIGEWHHGPESFEETKSHFPLWDWEIIETFDEGHRFTFIGRSPEAMTRGTD